MTLFDDTATHLPSSHFIHGAARDEASIKKDRKAADENFVEFWAMQAKELEWRTPWTTDCHFEAPRAKWFEDGRLNVTDSCLKRHALGTNANKRAILWEGEPGDTRTLTYLELYQEVQKAALGLRKLGVEAGDRVAIYMPLVPEAIIAMQACAFLGATHSVVFGGFSSDSLRDRINDAECKVLITADGGYRKGRVIPLASIAHEATRDNCCPSLENVVVLKRIGSVDESNLFKDGGFFQTMSWAELIVEDAHDFEATSLEAEHPLFILYTSGTTGKPKGVVHSTGGYLTQAAYTFRTVFDHRKDDIFWCSADVGWVTGHSYLAYGPLANGSTIFMYEGAPMTPDAGRFWSMIEKYHISVFYTAPTAIRAFMKHGPEVPSNYDLSSLRLLGSVGEPINPEAWEWYHEHIGSGRCPIVDTWWQTETGAIMVSPLPSETPTKPGSATREIPGIKLEILREDGSPAGENESGYLVSKQPWPSMMRTVWGDDERFQKTYWSKFKGAYFTGDSARRDSDGYIWIGGRVDDVVNVSGHRLGTMEIESSLLNHPAVVESAVVSRPDDLSGEAIVAFVTLQGSIPLDKKLSDEVKAQVTKDIGAFARPADVRFVEALPKTRSGKIMRRLLRQLAREGVINGDITSLEDKSIVTKLLAER